MKQGFEFYRSLGSKSARITSLCVTPLDDSHSVVKAGWEMLFARRGGERQIFRERGLIRSA